MFIVNTLKYMVALVTENIAWTLVLTRTVISALIFQVHLMEHKAYRMD